MGRRPEIGVTGPDKGGLTAWIFTWLALRRAGARAVRLRPGKFRSGRTLPRLDGLVLGGGADVDPGRYGSQAGAFKEALDETRRRGNIRGWAGLLLAPVIYLVRRLFSLSASGKDLARDRFEERCLELALAEGAPVLGICRGAQFLNIHFGGSLHAELSGFYGERGNISTVLARKTVHLVEGSRLEGWLRTDNLLVNSLHRQAVDRLGEGLVVSARDEAGVVQAIEGRDRRFLIGVQWHPEYLPLGRRQQGLFRELVRAAGGGGPAPAGLPVGGG